MPDEMVEQLPHLWEILEALNLPVIKKPGVEAADIVGTLAVEAEKEERDVEDIYGERGESSGTRGGKDFR